MAELFSGISDTIMDGIQAILYATIYKLLYYIAVGCCWIVNLLYSMFEIMAGLSKVSYDGDYEYLINIFFSNTTVSKVYWGMALIGLTAGFAFAIAAVIKKLFDMSEKEKRSYGQILTGLFKSILTILCMSLIITMVLNATTLLMQQINYVFVNADDLGEEQSITYTDEEYAAMTRVLSTIGNFSLNPSYNNRYNLNKCFNEIRLDLQYLKTQGVFDFHYVTKDMEGNTIATWQSALQKIANSASLERDLSVDDYHESVSNSVLQAMDLLKVNGSFKPLEDYQRHYQTSRTSLPMDRFLFLMSSMRAAKNDDYNKNPSLTDPLRGAYYYGEKSIYDLDTVNEDFDIGVAAFDYIILLLTCYKMLETLATIILNCVGRIFNMLLLYLISPLVIAVSPLDDGGKFKQWTTAFIVQSFSVFGTVLSMRVLLLFMPVVVDNKLVLFDNPIANLLTKLVIILGAFEVAEKATNLITGILADNAGWQSITAGDMSSAAKTAVGYGWGAAKGVGGFGLSAAGLGMKGGLKAAGLGAKVVGGAGLLAGYGVYGATKGAISGGKAIAGKISAWRNNKNSGGENKGAAGGSSSGPEANKQTELLPENQRDNLTNTENTGTTQDSLQDQQLSSANSLDSTPTPTNLGNTLTQGTGGATNTTPTNLGNPNPQGTVHNGAPTQGTGGGNTQITGGATNTTPTNLGNPNMQGTVQNVAPIQGTTGAPTVNNPTQTRPQAKTPPKATRRK